MFMFRRIFAIKRVFLTRGVSTKESLIDLTIDQESIALISLMRPPVNSLNLELLQEINSSLDVVRKNECKGVVFTSSLKVFSAGADLNELNNPDPMRLRKFWSAFQDLFLNIFGSGETTATFAINGHTAAGACVLSLLCDYRVMVNNDKARIGLNDTMVGLIPVPWVCSLMNRTMGCRQAEIALTASTMYTAEEALKVNLIDETASDKEDAIDKCKEFIRRYDGIPPKVKAQTKRNLRSEIIRLVDDKENREEDIRIFIQSVFDPYVQKQIDKYMEQLKQRKNKK